MEGFMRYRKTPPRYITNKRVPHRTITIKEESLYKPFLVTFSLFLVVMIIVFPTSIFDQTIPGVMVVLRKLIGWMSLSAVATLLVLPVSVFDIELIRTFTDTASFSNLAVVGVVLFAVFADTVFAYVGYRFTKTLRHLFMRKVKNRNVEISNERLQKYGNIGMFIFAVTPLPFTAAIYTAGALRLNKRGFLLAVALARLIKYSAFALFIRIFGINLIEWGQNFLTVLFG